MSVSEFNAGSLKELSKLEANDDASPITLNGDERVPAS